MKKDKELLPIGTIVKIFGSAGEYKILGYNKDGSYCLYGGQGGYGSFRDTFKVKEIPLKKRKRYKE